MTIDADPDKQFTGKYEASGRIGQWLVDRFYAAVLELADRALGQVPHPLPSVLEVGCGAGFSTARIEESLGARTRLTACDIVPSLVKKARARNPHVPIDVGSVYALRQASQSQDLIFLLEVLEHLDDPACALAELQRVTSSYLILSTPNEPIWRALNMARGKYWANAGNTPGHIQHWSSRSLRREVAPYFEVVAQRRPLPWTILLLRRINRD